MTAYNRITIFFSCSPVLFILWILILLLPFAWFAYFAVCFSYQPTTPKSALRIGMFRPFRVFRTPHSALRIGMFHLRFALFHDLFHLPNPCSSRPSRVVPPCSAIFRHHFLSLLTSDFPISNLSRRVAASTGAPALAPSPPLAGERARGEVVQSSQSAIANS